MKKCVDICNELNAPILGGVNYAAWGYLTKKPRSQDEWNWGVENMKQVAAYAKETGNVTICVECVNRFETHFLNIAEDAVAFCKATGMDNVKVHLDCFHMIREEKSFSEAVKTCGKQYLGYVHVNENDRGIPGTGLVPFKEFFEAIKEIGYDGPLVIESFDPSFEELEKVVTSIENSFINSTRKEISSKEIGEMVMDKLKDIDQVAYVRFASVYREFKDVDSFMEEIKKILK